MTDPLTPAQRDIIRETTERGFADAQDALVERIAAFIETWNAPANPGGARFRLAQHVRAHFGTSATVVVPTGEMRESVLGVVQDENERAG